MVTSGTPISSVDFQPTTTLVGSTTFASKITGGTPPFTCTWNFGDLTPTETGCNPTHTYTSSGNFTVTLYVVDSAGSTGSATKVVNVQPAPTITSFKFDNQVDWASTVGFRVTVTNPSSLTVNATVTIDIYHSSAGVFVARLTATATIAPHGTATLTLSFRPAPTAAEYTFQANLTYSASLGTFNGQSLTVTGSNSTTTGSFDVQSPTSGQSTPPLTRSGAALTTPTTSSPGLSLASLFAYIGGSAGVAAVLALFSLSRRKGVQSDSRL
jgi:PKD repeat protein